MYDSGIIISEAASIEMKDLSLYKNLVKVKGKGGKERFVIFSRYSVHWINRYLDEVRPGLIKRSRRYLFLNKFGNCITRKGIWIRYKKIAKKAGMVSTPHALRHSFASVMLKGGAGIEIVQALLGHASIETTMIYTHVDEKQLEEAHRKYLPKIGGPLPFPA